MMRFSIEAPLLGVKSSEQEYHIEPDAGLAHEYTIVIRGHPSASTTIRLRTPKDAVPLHERHIWICDSMLNIRIEHKCHTAWWDATVLLCQQADLDDVDDMRETIKTLEAACDLRKEATSTDSPLREATPSDVAAGAAGGAGWSDGAFSYALYYPTRHGRPDHDAALEVLLHEGDLTREEVLGLIGRGLVIPDTANKRPDDWRAFEVTSRGDKVYVHRRIMEHYAIEEQELQEMLRSNTCSIGSYLPII